ncbi:GOLPH3/VPS74 family protein [Actinomadura parmotrematis]|uniref:GPP34 family phosphoprotein n=1 Tax=Actinomadura parmotrematis TaxID=2864039 RepID=A0ABS7FZE1_9ACTN|nr:GPP34 family phosphoprotein [Actinomadura parmotrematis]MBW8485515.1 GPP34 family phosphoprotein [Actinomadura parmotrematis]
MVSTPETLPARMYLLAYDLKRGRIVRSNLGLVLRAAALTELYLDGRLAEDGRRPMPGTPGDDPYGVLAQIAASRPRGWQHWIRKDRGAIVAAVRDELARDGYVRVERGRRFGLLPCTRVTVKDPRVVKGLWGGARSALRGRPVAHVNSYDAAAVALAAAGGMRTVLTRRERRQHKARIEELTARSGPAAPALRKAIAAQEAAAAS